MALRAAIHEFFVEGMNRKQSHVLLHITEPATPEEWQKGYFFALVELKEATIDQIQHMQQVIDDLEAGYYESDDDEDKNAFEATLEYLNRRSGTILNDSGTIHCIVGVLKDKHISFAYHGAPHALLFYHAKNKLHYTNVLQEEESQEEQLFSSILEGQLNDGDSFFVATPEVTDHVSQEQFFASLTSSSPEESIQLLEKKLKESGSSDSFGGILLHIPATGNTQVLSTSQASSGSEASLNHLFEAEKQTAATLSPPLMGTLKDSLRQKNKQPQTRKETTKKRQTAEFNYRASEAPEATGSTMNTILIYTGRGLVQGALGLWRIILAIVLTIWRGFLFLLILLTNKNNGRRELLTQFRERRERFSDSYTGLSMLSKILLFATLLLALVFVASIGYLRLKEDRDAREQVYLEQVNTILTKKDDADASSIYGNTEKSFALLKEAEALIEALPTNTDERVEKKNELSAAINEQMKKIQKVETVPQTLVADLSTEATQTTPHLTKIDDLLIAYGSEERKLITIDLNTSQTETKVHDTLPVLTDANTPKEQDAILFTTVDNTIVTYDKQTKTVTSQNITFANPDPAIVAPFIYNTRLYLIDKSAHQIYRHTKTATGYDKGASWLPTPDIDLGNAVSLAIDGSLYALRSSGEILKYTQGVREVFGAKGLEPGLSAPTRIWTHNTTDNLYILEPEQKRIVVLDKIGRLVRQYTATEWQRPTDFIVEEEDGKIYVIDSNKVYSFSTK